MTEFALLYLADGMFQHIMVHVDERFFLHDVNLFGSRLSPTTLKAQMEALDLSELKESEPKSWKEVDETVWNLAMKF